MNFLGPLFVAIMLFAQASIAQENVPFGLENAYLARLFLEEAIDIAQSNAGTRDLSGNTRLRGADEFTILKEAYRADPDATLDLIERILKAGRTQ